MLWCAVNPSSSALCFEPNPTTRNILRCNVARNGFSDRVAIRAEAVSNKKGTALFSARTEQPGWSGFVNEVSKESTHIPTVALDDVISDRVSLLKIDAEGADSLVLQGAAKLLSAKLVQTIVWEGNCTGMCDGFNSVEFVRKFGYYAVRFRDGWLATV